MKVEIFTPVVYYGPSTVGSWPASPRLYDPKFGMQSMEWGFEQCEGAYRAGFDSLNFAEHHYSTSQLSPNPIFYAGILGQRLPDAHIGVLGTDLPLNNPVRVAEEYAMLDNLLNGRITIGLLRGTPNEYMTYNTSPYDSREMMDEAVELFIKCLSEPEPFGWEGRYYRYRNVAIWPHPVQQPHPRILLSANSESSARFAGKHKCDIGFSFMAPEKCKPNLDVYMEAAAEAGWEPTAENILYRQFCLVAETDAEAQKIAEESGWPTGPGLFAAGTTDIMMAMGTCGAAMGGLPRGVPVDLSKAPPMAFDPPWLGGPETVLRQIGEIHDTVGMGRAEFIVAGVSGSLDHAGVMRSLEVMGETIVPALHAGSFAMAGAS
jgi:alkanesulfonate monooxygenase SsuD/methylene tetrahydromethanopterin reductase-like flavin-dependent oxidoreductase (luciferase family)